jgi:hypothetical protein
LPGGVLGLNVFSQQPKANCQMAAAVSRVSAAATPYPRRQKKFLMDTFYVVETGHIFAIAIVAICDICATNASIFVDLPAMVTK